MITFKEDFDPLLFFGKKFGGVHQKGPDKWLSDNELPFGCYLALDFIFHVGLTIIAPVGLWLYYLKEEYDDEVNAGKIFEKILFCLTIPPVCSIIFTLALVIAIPTRTISTIVSPVVGCISRMLGEENAEGQNALPKSTFGL